MSGKCQDSVSHGNHEHTHDAKCGHKRVKHEGHVGYLHDGCLHCHHHGHYDEHSLNHKVGNCSNGHDCCDHVNNHQHGDNCGHSKVPHDGHFDYLVNGHLHHFHNGHCDHHGELVEVCEEHENHGSHEHGEGCGHVQIVHEGHSGFLHNGHLHCTHDSHIDEHKIQVSDLNPTGCVGKSTECLNGKHSHGPNCGHSSIPHGDHVDYIVNGILHHFHGDHCDQHGSIKVVYPKHPRHNHTHGKGCGHLQVKHDGHVDFLHDGHLHHHSTEGYEEHNISNSIENPSECTPNHSCQSHASSHLHGSNCGHAMIAHGDHFDFLVDGHLHHPHGSHCDHHGSIVLVH